MKVSRRKFLAGSAATAAGAAVASSGISLLSERAEAFFNMGAFWKKPVGSGQTSNGYTIGQSLRFNPANSTFLSRAVSVGGNQQTWTLSMWVKRTALTIANDFLFGVSLSGADNFGIRFGSGGNANDNLDIYSQFDNEFGSKSVQLFRDPSAWGHLVLAMDVTQGTNANKIKIYWNGVQITSLTADESFAGPYPTATTAMQPNAASTVMYLGKRGSGAAVYTSCYVAEFCWVDGQQLSPTSFGQIDTNSGQWIPKAPSVSDYGKNGCYLNFSNSSSLGTDSAPISGNHTAANNWTPTNFNTYDQVLDSPTNNFCAWNPLTFRLFGSNFGSMTWSSGNLSVNGVSLQATTGSIGVTTGKWYYECTFTYSSLGGNFNYSGEFGLVDSAGNFWLYYGSGGNPNGTIYANAATVSSSVAQFTVGDIIGVQIDLSGSPTYTFYKNGSSIGTYSFTPTGAVFPFASYGSGSGSGISWTAIGNFGQGGQTGLTYDAASGGRFKYTPLAGFKALCTVNLPSGMSAVTSSTFTGNASSDGPFVWLGGSPTDLTINGNTVTWGTHADKLANGFKIRTSNSSYNASGSNSFSATVPAKFKWATAR
jgi:hypothetical protein